MKKNFHILIIIIVLIFQLSIFLIFFSMVCCDVVEENQDQTTENFNDDIHKMIKKSIFDSIFSNTDLDNQNLYNFMNYRKILKGQRWKKSKSELFRPAYGFGKKKRSYNMPSSLGHYIIDDNGSNLFNTQYYRLF